MAGVPSEAPRARAMLAGRGMTNAGVDAVLDQLQGMREAAVDMEDNKVTEEGVARIVERMLPVVPMGVDACLQTARDDAREIAEHFRGAQISALMNSLDLFEKVLACDTASAARRVIAGDAPASSVGKALFSGDQPDGAVGERAEFVEAVLKAQTRQDAERLHATLMAHAKEERARILARAFSTSHPFTETLKAQALRDILRQAYTFEYVLYCLAFYHQTHSIAADVKASLLDRVKESHTAQSGEAWGADLEEDMRVLFIDKMIATVCEPLAPERTARGTGDASLQGTQAPASVRRETWCDARAGPLHKALCREGGPRGGGSVTVGLLRLGGNPVGDLGALHLARLLRFDSVLTTLYVNRCCIGDEGAEHIAEALKTCNRTLTFLDVSQNAVTDVGGVALAEVFTKNRVLTTLRVAGNSISDEVEGLITRATAGNAGKPSEDAFLSNARMAEAARSALQVPPTPAGAMRYNATLALTPHHILPGCGTGGAPAPRSEGGGGAGGGIANAALVEETMFRIRTLLLLGRSDRALNVVEDFLHDAFHCADGARRCRNRNSSVPAKGLGKTVLTQPGRQRPRRRPPNMEALFENPSHAEDEEGVGQDDDPVRTLDIDTMTPPVTPPTEDPQRPQLHTSSLHSPFERTCDGPPLHGTHVASLPAAKDTTGCGDVVAASCGAVCDDDGYSSPPSSSSSCSGFSEGGPAGAEGLGVLPGAAPYIPIVPPPEPSVPTEGSSDGASEAASWGEGGAGGVYAPYYAAPDSDYEHFVNAWSEGTADRRAAKRRRPHGTRYSLYHKAGAAWDAADWRTREEYIKPHRAAAKAAAAARAAPSISPSQRASPTPPPRSTGTPGRTSPRGRQRLYSFDVGREGAARYRAYFPNPDTDYHFFVNEWARERFVPGGARRYVLLQRAEQAWREGDASTRATYAQRGRDRQRGIVKPRSAAANPTPPRRVSFSETACDRSPLRSAIQPQPPAEAEAEQPAKVADGVCTPGRVAWLTAAGQRVCVRFERSAGSDAPHDVWVEVDGVVSGGVARGAGWPLPPSSGTWLRGGTASMGGVIVTLPADVQTRAKLVRALFPSDVGYVRQERRRSPVGEGEGGAAEAAAETTAQETSPPSSPPRTAGIRVPARHRAVFSFLEVEGAPLLGFFDLRGAGPTGAYEPCIVAVFPTTYQVYTHRGALRHELAAAGVARLLVGHGDGGALHVVLRGACAAEVVTLAGAEAHVVPLLKVIRALAMRRGAPLKVEPLPSPGTPIKAQRAA
eukprot:TRINITY_DN2240_c1_g2_i1.p1 TRINITY_DN2240_c1_g2~~TRINITY_DN2240_c1_g2_i1.p1  ORF type:complete len:1258 (+),score=227.94 TRINITY_DN2240_c1_g2_i1:122-3895(+)